MRTFARVGLLILSLGAAISAATPPIVPAVLLEHIKFLASDDMKGRASGSPELERAAEYIAEQFKSAGLRPGVDGDWYQPFQIEVGLQVGEGNALSIRGGTRSAQLVLGEDYYPLGVAAGTSLDQPSTLLENVPLVFAGYGLSMPGLNYDDYEGVDVGGKAVIILSHEPQEMDRTSRINGNQPVPESSLYAKAAAARRHGARLVIVVSDPRHQIDQATYSTFPIQPDADDVALPVLRVRRTKLLAMLNAWGLDRLAADIDRDLQPRSRELPGATVNYREFIARDRRAVRNVIGIVPGADPQLSREAIVIGAHYDHVGLGGRFSVSPERTGEVHNGADDNASGTASVIEIAKAAAADPSRFPRTLVFVLFSGEERGLLGSAHYANNPVVPLADTVAMLNLDMVGRSRGDVDITGLELAPSLRPVFRDAIAGIEGIRMREDGPGAGRSDDSSFIDRGIPAFNFFTGFHPDYHRPSDDWPAIDAPGTARVATLALEFAARIAARPERPEFVRPRRR
ncbi:MAG: M28 family peptidase [Vicinamibacterales bacterium]